MAAFLSHSSFLKYVIPSFSNHTSKIRNVPWGHSSFLNQKIPSFSNHASKTRNLLLIPSFLKHDIPYFRHSTRKTRNAPWRMRNNLQKKEAFLKMRNVPRHQGTVRKKCSSFLKHEIPSFSPQLEK